MKMFRVCKVFIYCFYLDDLDIGDLLDTAIGNIIKYKRLANISSPIIIKNFLQGFIIGACRHGLTTGFHPSHLLYKANNMFTCFVYYASYLANLKENFPKIKDFHRHLTLKRSFKAFELRRNF